MVVIREGCEWGRARLLVGPKDLDFAFRAFRADAALNSEEANLSG
jgi:hypothetical protein